MTTSIKAVTTSEAKNRIEELFGDISLQDIKVVNLANLIDEEQTLNNSVKLANIDDFRKNLKISLNREITTEDVSVVKLNEGSSFDISTTTASGLSQKFKDLGIDLSSLGVAVVTAEELGLNQNTTNSVKKFKK